MAHRRTITTTDGILVLPKFEPQALDAAVRRGVRLLNRLYGKDRWARRVDPTTLRMISPCDCILGQMFPVSGHRALFEGNGFNRGRRHLYRRATTQGRNVKNVVDQHANTRVIDATYYGFSVGDVPAQEYLDEWRWLQFLWSEQIARARKRLKKRKA